MKKLKLVFLLIIVLLVSGCSGTYNIKINKDLTINEELDVILEKQYNNYSSVESILENKGIDKNDYKIVGQGEDLKVTYKHKYQSVEEYILESKLYKQLFDNISYNTDKENYTLEARNIFDLNNIELDNSYSIKLLQVNVTTPLNVIDENSDSSSENTYSWTIDNKTKEKYIYMYFSVNDRKINTGTILVISSIIISLIIFIIIVIKRLLDARKI